MINPQSAIVKTMIEGGVRVASAMEQRQLTTDKALRFIVVAVLQSVITPEGIITRPVSGS
jgi:hypothetical protein|tara:strand:+ start:3253 stop:3432 length:180 start_codon:yes stop_codon:yes gene_type:complete